MIVVGVDSHLLHGGKVEHDFKGASSVGSHLSKNDVFGNSRKCVNFCMLRCFQKDLNSFLKGGFPKCPRVNSIDTMSRDRGESSSVGHGISESGQMSVVHINTVGSENMPQLSDKTESCRLNSKNFTDFDWTI